MKIDISRWQNFQIKDLFEKVESQKKKDFNKNFDVATELTNEFDLPLVNAKHGNNGIMYYGRSSEMDSFKNVLCVVQNGAIATGDVYAHVDDVGILEDAYLIKPKFETSRYILLFMSCVLQRAIKQHFSYDDKAIWDKVKKLFLPLPVDNNNNPNWPYMERYMQETEQNAKDELDKYSAISAKKSIIDISHWKEFPLINLFEIVLSNDDLQAQKLEDGDIPLVSSGKTQNGICKYIEEQQDSTIYSGGSITVDMFGKAFYQSDDFYAVSHGRVNILKPLTPLSKYSGIFISQVIESTIMNQSSFVNMCTSSILKKTDIPLPADSNGVPDWKYMEEYVSNLKALTDRKLDYFLSVM